MDVQPKDWGKARSHLIVTQGHYTELIGDSRVNPYFALIVIAGLERRYAQGERTQELYDEMMALE